MKVELLGNKLKHRVLVSLNDNEDLVLSVEEASQLAKKLSRVVGLSKITEISPTRAGVLKGLRQARDLALTQARAAEKASETAAVPMWPIEQFMFGRAHAQALRALARRLQGKINQTLLTTTPKG